MSELQGPAWDHLLVGDRVGGGGGYGGIGPGVKINKIPGSAALTRKDRLCINYRWMQEQFGETHFSFLPDTFNLPEDIPGLGEKMTGDVWVTKPPTGSCGTGIKLVTDLAQIQLGKKKLTVQRYITNPFLINGLKFDLRLYVLLTSIDPVKIYLYNDGLVRFATKSYSNNEQYFDDKYIHLTNYSINKNNDSFQYNEDPTEFRGHKWSLKTLWKYLENKGFDPVIVNKKIEDLVIKTVLCGQYDIVEAVNSELQSDYTCYKLFGVDVLLDQNLKPWLLELNDFPSLETPTLDRHVNEPMIAEMFNIVGFHITHKISKNKSKVLSEKYDLKNVKEFDAKLYSREKSLMQRKKEEYYTREDMPREEYLLLRKGENLTGRDVRILVRAEEELAQTVNFSRLFPCKDSYKYLDYVEIQSYSDRLLESWEVAYGDKRSLAMEVLGRLCKAGVHLEDL